MVFRNVGAGPSFPSEDDPADIIEVASGKHLFSPDEVKVLHET